MVRVYKRDPGARQYVNYDEEKLALAISAVQDGRLSLRKAHKEYGIPLGTLSHKVRGKYNNPHGRPTALSEGEESSLVNHIKVVSDWGFPFDMIDLRMLVRTYLSKAGRHVRQFKNNLPSNEWVSSFLKRNKDALSTRQCQNIKKVRAKVSASSATQFFQNLATTLKNEDGTQVPPTNIFNYDETNLSDDPGTKKCIFRRGVKYPERVRDSTKTSTSIMFCGSAAGQMMPAYVVYKAEHLWSTWTESGPPNTRYNRSKSGWFDAQCFADWFESLFVPFVKHLPGKKVIIGDNLSSHFNERVLELAKQHDIVFTCLVANSTHLFQPLDVAFYGPLKRYWRSILDEWKVRCGKKSSTLTKESFPGLLRKLYTKLYPDEMDMSTNIIAGFKKCGIYPLNPDEVLKCLPDSELAERTNDDINADVSGAVVEMLRSLRGVDEEPTRKRRKKISVEPGKSISVEDITAAPSTSASAATPSTSASAAAPSTSASAAASSTSASANLKKRKVNVTKSTCRDGSDSDYSEMDCIDSSPDESGSSDDDDTEDDEVTDDSNSVKTPQNGKFYLIKFDSKRSVKHFVGKLLSSDGTTDTYEMVFMRQSTKVPFKFVWPNVTDRGNVEERQIIKCLSTPREERRGGLVFGARQLHHYTKSLQ